MCDSHTFAPGSLHICRVRRTHESEAHLGSNVIHSRHRGSKRGQGGGQQTGVVPVDGWVMVLASGQ